MLVMSGLLTRTDNYCIMLKKTVQVKEHTKTLTAYQSWKLFYFPHYKSKPLHCPSEWCPYIINSHYFEKYLL